MVTGGAGSFFVSKITGNGSILLPMTSSFGFALLFIAVNLIANGKASYACLMNALCFILVSLLFAFLAKITKQKHKRRRFK
jgi:ABC-type Fe3+-siderophore transport system permease subunit